jgi:hypothetical protein
MSSPAKPRGSGSGDALAHTGSLSALLSTLPAPSPVQMTRAEATQAQWMAPGGRLRIGSDGVPVKFNLHKSKGSEAAAAAAAAALQQLLAQQQQLLLRQRLAQWRSGLCPAAPVQPAALPAALRLWQRPALRQRTRPCPTTWSCWWRCWARRQSWPWSMGEFLLSLTQCSRSPSGGISAGPH